MRGLGSVSSVEVGCCCCCCCFVDVEVEVDVVRGNVYFVVILCGNPC